MIKFFVPGEPMPGGSKKGFVNPRTGRVIVQEDCKGNKGWRANVALAAQRAYSGPLLDVPLDIRVTFFRLRPRGHYGTGRNAAILKPSAPPFPTGAPDTTKLLRSTEDALKGVLWTDDALIVDQHAFKRWGDKPGAMIEVRERTA